MGAVFTIFLFSPLFLPILAAEKFLELFGIDSLAILDKIMDLFFLWLSANPEIADMIKNILIG
ncbi:MAG: hypothetical protein IKK63_02395 [Clostridia bacterium]|nr:hypothetical protein [Clostridia bacterium]MBR3819243.1 hypothetical protein [Clostridia bacterium]